MKEEEKRYRLFRLRIVKNNFRRLEAKTRTIHRINDGAVVSPLLLRFISRVFRKSTGRYFRGNAYDGPDTNLWIRPYENRSVRTMYRKRNGTGWSRRNSVDRYLISRRVAFNGTLLNATPRAIRVFAVFSRLVGRKTAFRV